MGSTVRGQRTTVRGQRQYQNTEFSKQIWFRATKTIIFLANETKQRGMEILE